MAPQHRKGVAQGQRGVAGRFDDQGVAGQQSRSDHQIGQVDRRVPGHDDRHRSHRDMPSHNAAETVVGYVRCVETLRQAGVVAEDLRRSSHIVGRLGEGLAVLPRVRMVARSGFPASISSAAASRIPARSAALDADQSGKALDAASTADRAWLAVPAAYVPTTSSGSAGLRTSRNASALSNSPSIKIDA